jgi:hypothetical protein
MGRGPVGRFTGNIYFKDYDLIFGVIFLKLILCVECVCVQQTSTFIHSFIPLLIFSFTPLPAVQK